MILSLPNSGSSWFARELAAGMKLNYYMEFFNPLRNQKYESILVKNFGCELLSCYRNIVSPGDARIHDDIRKTFGREPYQMTKEVFSPYKLPVFVEHFRVIVLHRSAAETFPPRRARIWSFYEHIWHALEETGPRLRAKHVHDRALEAFEVVSAQLLSDARRYNVPIISYEDLSRDAYASPALLFGADAVAQCKKNFVKLARPKPGHEN